MRTVNVKDFINVRQFDRVDQMNTHIRKKTVSNGGIEFILEPLQKWKLPDELVRIAVYLFYS